MTTPYRVYIAAASVPSEIERVEFWGAKLTEAGIEVISTWPRNIREVGTANPRDATRDQRGEWARTCADQVVRANALWLMCPPEGVTTRGAWFELGIAYATGTDVIASGDTTQTIFTAVALEECVTDVFACSLIEEWSSVFAQRNKWDADKDSRSKTANHKAVRK